VQVGHPPGVAPSSSPEPERGVIAERILDGRDGCRLPRRGYERWVMDRVAGRALTSGAPGMDLRPAGP
jgi:hypothetical protein